MSKSNLKNINNLWGSKKTYIYYNQNTINNIKLRLKKQNIWNSSGLKFLNTFNPTWRFGKLIYTIGTWKKKNESIFLYNPIINQSLHTELFFYKKL